MNTNRYFSLLRRLGLSEKESSIYLDLVEHGESSITDVVERTRIHRPDAYKYLPLLVERGFVTETLRGKRRFFTAESPEGLKSLLEGLETDLERVLPDLVGMHSRSGRRPTVKFLEGRKAISFVFSDIVSSLKKGDVFYRVSSEKDVDLANSYLPADYRERRDKKELERYVIMSEGQSSKKAPRLEREIVTIPPELDEFSDDVSMIVYGGKVAFIDYNTEASIIVENAFIAGFQEKLFKLLYRALKRGGG